MHKEGGGGGGGVRERERGGGGGGEYVDFNRQPCRGGGVHGF